MTSLYLSLILVTVIWGGAFPAIAVAMRSLTPYELLVYRHIIAVACFYPWLRKSWRALPMKELPVFLFLGTLMVPVYHIGLNGGQLRVPPAVASFIISLTPVLTGVLAGFVLNEKISLSSVAGLGLGLVGVAAMVLEGEIRGDFPWRWTLWVFVALVSAAVNTIVAKRVLARYDPVSFTSWSLGVGTLISVLLMPVMQKSYAAPRGAEVWVSLVFLGVISNFAAYWLWFNALKRLDASRTVSFLYLVPLWGLLLSALLTHEALTTGKVIGGALVVVGVVLGTRTLNRRSAAPAGETVGLPSDIHAGP
jgi:drug/metabolite transporter (DMT)-like permease